VLANPRLPSPAPEILDYLAKNPYARCTLDDFYWRVLDDSLRDLAPKIAKTVAQLVEQGFLEQKQSRDGKVFYRVTPHYLATLQQRPSSTSCPDDKG
jgi:hypothetical protein